jgi:hypothetical protein
MQAQGKDFVVRITARQPGRDSEAVAFVKGVSEQIGTRP